MTDHNDTAHEAELLSAEQLKAELSELAYGSVDEQQNAYKFIRGHIATLEVKNRAYREENEGLARQVEKAVTRAITLEARLEEAKRALERIYRDTSNEGIEDISSRAITALPATPKWLECMHLVVSTHNKLRAPETLTEQDARLVAHELYAALDRLTEAMEGTK